MLLPIKKLLKISPQSITTVPEIKSIEYARFETEAGDAFVGVNDSAIATIWFASPDEDPRQWLASRFPEAAAVCSQEPEKIAAMLDGEVKIITKGSPFQEKIWRTAARIPYGKTSTYKGLAMQAGREGASRAVGSTLGRNPVALLIPCHRVVPASGGVGNYRWGTDLKKTLLALEKEQ